MMRPPVVEVVVGIQFQPLKQFHNGHLGLFWGEMKGEYPNASDANPVEQVLEAFGDEPEFRIPGLAFEPAGGDARLRMTSGNGVRMLQVHNGWLLANWIRGETGTVESSPILDIDGVPDQIGHVIIPELQFARRKEAREYLPGLARAVFDVEGPFPASSEDDESS